MKKFGFTLSEALHQELQETAEAQSTSMAAICREALTTHLHRHQNPCGASIEEALLGIPPLDAEKHSWSKLKSQVRDFLEAPEVEMNPAGVEFLEHLTSPFYEEFELQEQSEISLAADPWLEELEHLDSGVESAEALFPEFDPDDLSDDIFLHSEVAQTYNELFPKPVPDPNCTQVYHSSLTGDRYEEFLDAPAKAKGSDVLPFTLQHDDFLVLAFEMDRFRTDGHLPGHVRETKPSSHRSQYPESSREADERWA